MKTMLGLSAAADVVMNALRMSKTCGTLLRVAMSLSFLTDLRKKCIYVKINVSAANIRLMNNDFKQGVVSGGYNESGVRALMIVSKFTKNNKSSIWQHCCQLVASSVVVTTTYGATSDGKVVKLTTFYFQYYVILSNWNMICSTLVIPMP